MSLSLYMDVRVPLAITHALRGRGAHVLTSQEDGSRRLSDAALLGRAELIALLCEPEEFYSHIEYLPL